MLGKSSCEIFTEIRNPFSCTGKTEISANLAELEALETFSLEQLVSGCEGKGRCHLLQEGSTRISEGFGQALCGVGSCPHQAFASNPAAKTDEKNEIRD